MTTRFTASQKWLHEVLAAFESRLLRYAASIVRDPDLARDVVQETFLRLCDVDRDRVEDQLGAWLFTVCRNRALDIKRKESRVELTEDMDTSFETAQASPVARTEFCSDLQRALVMIDGLPDKEREVVALRFQGELSYREIAQVCGYSVSHVGVLLHTAINRLRAEFQDDDARAARAGGGDR